jgi:predicted dehydrogenase
MMGRHVARKYSEESRRMAEQETRIGVVGCGFWSRFQVAAWGEVKGARVVAACDRERGKAEALSARFGIPGVFA